jgi:uncharacterized protein
MKLIFVDTSAWDALADRGDEHHVRALQFRDKIAQKRRLVPHNYVLDELYTLLLMNIGYEKAIGFKKRLDLLISERVLQMGFVRRP